jgi:Tfp pilus assembly protein PilO
LAEESRAEHASLEKKVRELKSLLTDVRERIPDSPNETLFLQQVTEAAKASNVHIRAYNRGKIEEFATHAQLEVHIAGAGGYQPICQFIDELSKLSRITSIEQLKIESSPDTATYPIEMRLLLFFNRTTSKT